MKTSEWSFTPFKGLKQVFESSKSALRKEIPAETKSDEQIFNEAMADVKEIKEFRELSVEKSKAVRHRPALRDNSIEILEQVVRGEKKIRLSDTDEYMEGTVCNIRKGIARELHEGRFSVQDSIDLHGMTRIEAEEALSLFFREAMRKGLFCIKIIHGRGLRSPNGPVLKDALKRLLQGQFRKWILAYSTAKDCDGGLGATYVILKSNLSVSNLNKVSQRRRK